MKILVTGSRNLPDRYKWQVWEEILKASEDHDEIEIVVGDCRSGADRFARRFDGTGFASQRKFIRITVNTFFAKWDKEGRAAGPIRNQRMVDYGADICLAFFYKKETPGTKGCTDRAAKAGIPVKKFYFGLEEAD